MEGCPSGQREQTVNLPALAFEGSNPSPPPLTSGSSSVGRALAFQAKGREFEPRLPLHFSTVSMTGCPCSSVEHFLGKEEVMSSNLIMGSTIRTGCFGL